MKVGALSISLLCASFESHVTNAQRDGVLKRKKNLRHADADASNASRKLFFAAQTIAAESELFTTQEENAPYDTSMSYEEDHIVYVPANMDDDDYVSTSMSYSMSYSMSMETEPLIVDVVRSDPNPSIFYTSIFSNGQQSRNNVKPSTTKGKGRKMMEMEPTETIPDSEYVRRYLGNSAADSMEDHHRMLQSMSYSMSYSMSMDMVMARAPDDYSFSYSMSMNMDRSDDIAGQQIPDAKGTSKLPRPIASLPQDIEPAKKTAKAPAANRFGKAPAARRKLKNGRPRRTDRQDWARVIYNDEPAPESMSYSMSLAYTLAEDSISSDYSYSMSYAYGSLYEESMSYDYSMSYAYGSLYDDGMSYDYSMSVSFGALAPGDDGWDDIGDVSSGALADDSSGSTPGSGSAGNGSGSGSSSGSGSNSGSGSGSNSGTGNGLGSGSNSGSGFGSGANAGSDSGNVSSGGFSAVKAPKGNGKAAKAPKPDRTSAAKSPGISGLARKNARRRAQARKQRELRAAAEAKEMPWTSTEEPSVFLLESIKDMYQDFGAHMTPTDQLFTSEIESQFSLNLCGKETCGGKMNIFKCLSCSSKSWFSAISESGKGAIHGYVDRDNNVVVPSDDAPAHTHTRLDIAVPMSGQDDKLRHFAARLGASLESFRTTPMGKQMSIRLFVTKYQGDFADMSMFDVKREISYLTKLETDDITFVDVLDSEFSRANAINNLHRNVCQESDCIVTVMDVDMFILPRFFYNANEFVQAGHSAYFPIVWSEYNPETVKLVDDFYALNGVKQSTYSNHHGTWRQYGFGLYAISGADASKFMLDERFKGWGGEDNDFYHRVSSGLNIVRMREHGLIHIFHSKECTAGSFVKTSMIQQCFGSKTSVEGSQLGLYLRTLRESDEATFNSIFGKDRYEDDVLLAVVTSRENLSSRVAAIRESWGQTHNIPANVHVRYFVGDGIESKFDLLRLAGIEDADELVVMTEVEDNEYPPVKKNTNMLKRIHNMMKEMESTGDMDFKYVMKVDDDTYVNFDGLLKFLAYRDHSETHQFFGERGYGYVQDREGLIKAGLKKPYCTGGPGYVMSRQTLDDTVQGIDECVHRASVSPYKNYLWHSDVVIGMCVTSQTGIGCYDDADYGKNRVFLNNYHGPENFVKFGDLKNVVTMHPFKKKGEMVRQHGRFEEPVEKAMKQLMKATSKE